MPSLSGWSRCRDVVAFYPEGAAELSAGTTIITGVTAGIGVETAKAIAGIGGRTILAARNSDKAVAVAADIRRIHPHAQVSTCRLDLSSLVSVLDFVDEYRRRASEEQWPPLKCLVLNAGVISMAHRVTIDGFEETFAVSHLAHFLLATELRPELQAAAPSRVVVVSSGSHAGPLATKEVRSASALEAHVVRPSGAGWGLLKAMQAYGSAKLCNCYMARAIATKFCDAEGITACSLHPGTMMATSIGRDSGLVRFLMRVVLAPFTKDMDQGSSTTLTCSLAPHHALAGRFYVDCQPGKYVYMHMCMHMCITTPSPAAFTSTASLATAWQAQCGSSTALLPHQPSPPPFTPHLHISHR